VRLSRFAQFSEQSKKVLMNRQHLFIIEESAQIYFNNIHLKVYETKYVLSLCCDLLPTIDF